MQLLTITVDPSGFIISVNQTDTSLWEFEKKTDSLSKKISVANRKLPTKASKSMASGFNKAASAIWNLAG